MPKTVKIKTEVYCTLQVEGVHNWSECPLEEVIYLRELHRHVFHIKAHRIVSHDDRDQEFIMLKHDILYHLLNTYASEGQDGHFMDDYVCIFGEMSCEMIAKELVSKFDLSRCEVSEDNENGAVVTVLKVGEKENE